MPTLNVTQSPYNAAGDGTTDDSDAIQSAIDDAQNGDTVYFPSGTYLIGTDTGSTTDADPLFVDDTYPNNITLDGDGHDQSILKMEGGLTDTDNINIIRIEPNSGLTGWLIQNLGFDGNNPNQTKNDPRSIYNITIGDADSDSASVDITFKHVDSFDALSTSMRTFTHGVTWERCSARNSKTDHGFGLNDGGPGTSLKYCYGADNNLYGVDSTGTTAPVIEDCVFENNGTTSGGAGGKLGDGGDTTTWRRVRFKNNGDRGFFTTGSGSGTCTFEDCIAEGHYREGFHLNSGYNYDVNGVLLADANNSSGNASGNVNIADTATGNIEELRSYNAVNGTGFDNQTGETDLGAYLYDGNAGGAGSTSNWTTTTNDTDQSELDQTLAPTASEVGAGSGTTTTSSVSGLDVSGGTLTVGASGSLGISPPTPSVTLVEDFEDTSPLSEWTNQYGNSITSVSDGTAYHGDTHANIVANGENWSRVGDGLNAYFTQGETIKVYMRPVGGTTESGWFRYSYADFDNSFRLQLNFNEPAIRLKIDDAGTGTSFASDTTVTYTTGDWYEAELSWNTDDTHDVTLTNASTSTQMTTISGTQTVGSWTDPGGDIALAAINPNGNSVDFDYLHKP